MFQNHIGFVHNAQLHAVRYTTVNSALGEPTVYAPSSPNSSVHFSNCFNSDGATLAHNTEGGYVEHTLAATKGQKQGH